MPRSLPVLHPRTILAVEDNQILSAVTMRSCTRRISAGQRPLPRSIYNIHGPPSGRAIKTCRSFRATDAGNILVLDRYGVAAPLTDHSRSQGHEDYYTAIKSDLLNSDGYYVDRVADRRVPLSKTQL